MNDLLLNIYHRNFEALEKPIGSGAKENRAMSHLEELDTKLREAIPEKYHPMLSDYYNAFMAVVDSVAEQDFLKGYRMGVQLMLAAWPKR